MRQRSTGQPASSPARKAAILTSPAPVALTTLLSRDRQMLPKDWRIPAFVLLWLYFLLTTTQAYYPALAWEKFWFVTKIYIPFFFTLVLINTREKLFYLIAFIAGSIALVAVKGGVFALATGFSYRVWGPPQTQFEDNNQFAIAILIAIPMMILCYREFQNRWIRLGIAGAIPLMLISAISSWSRGAFLTMGVLGLMLLWHSKRRILVIPALLVGAMLLVPALPEEWFSRMSTIENYQQDASAMGRIEVWKDGWQHTLAHPLLGAGFEGWLWVTQRDWHSSYVEMFSEHGFVAFAIWLSLILGTLFSLTRLPRTVKGVEGMQWVANYSYMLRAALVCYMVGTAFLGLSYWDLLYHLIFIAVLLKQFVLAELAEKLPQHSAQPVRGKPIGSMS